MISKKIEFEGKLKYGAKFDDLKLQLEFMKALKDDDQPKAAKILSMMTKIYIDKQ